MNYYKEIERSRLLDTIENLQGHPNQAIYDLVAEFLINHGQAEELYPWLITNSFSMRLYARGVAQNVLILFKVTKKLNW
jgi:hypothetical protein